MLKIDIRESDLIAKCQELVSAVGSPWKEIVVKSEVLPLGDIFVYESTTEQSDHILIERKTVADLMASIRDGRYEEQSYRLIHSNEHHPHNIVYLIEGNATKSSTGSFAAKRGGCRKEGARAPGQCKLKLPCSSDTPHTVAPEPAPLFSSSVPLPSVCTTETRIFYSALFSLNHYKGFSVMRTSSLEETALYCLYTALKMVTNKGKPERDRAVPAYSNPSAARADADANGVPNVAIETPAVGEEEVDEESVAVVPQDVAKYCTVVKKVKKENVTPENIGEIMLCQLPNISSIYAVAIMQHFGGSFARCIQSVQEDATALDSIFVTDAKGKKRKLPCSVKNSLIRYLR